MLKIYDSAGTPVEPRTSGYTFLSRTIITATATTSYTIPSGVRAILVRCIGAGASGGGGLSAAVSASLGSGGGSGAYADKFIVSPSASAITVAIGAGGIAATAGNNDGHDGNDTSFNSGVVLAKGGKAGIKGGAGTITPLFVLGGLGGPSASSVGDFVSDGASGGYSFAVSGTVGASGKGGDGPYGNGGRSAIVQGVGEIGSNYGAGGSGGATLNGGASTQSGAGANGVIIIDEYA